MTVVLSRGLAPGERRLVRAADLAEVLSGALEDLGRSAGVVCCRLSTAAEVRHLNARFAGLDQATDVLSFPAREERPGSGFQLPPEAEDLLGDMVISVATAAAQAEAGGSDPAGELRLLAIHGLLHLLGHDHHGAAEAQRMTVATRQLLAGHAARRGLPAPRVSPLRPGA